jgi:TolB-like protein/DNA-binding winged helix-turn-helix (wHTH) protein/Tfp pilus assembly protein PilF
LSLSLEAAVPLPSRTFGEFELDCARYELRRKGKTLRLERIPMELLLLLAEKDGYVVSRQEIVERLWGKDYSVDSEHGINTAIRKIRTALREDGARPRFIQTVQGKGYRFVADERTADVGAMASSEAGPPAPEPVVAKAGPRRRRLAAGLISLLSMAALLVGSNFGGIRDRAFGGDRPARIRSLAVLPLANLSGDSSQDYFVDGMTDELITMLAKNSSLRVVSRTSAMQYRNARRPLREIARELGVDGILEGSVERSGSRVHMNVQLLNAASDTHVWAESYDRDLNGALSLPSELSQTIAREVNTAAAPPEPRRRVDPEAHDAYLRGRYLWFGANDEESREYFEKAIQIQPDYAPAWSGLADFYVVRAVELAVPPQDVLAQAKDAAHKAVELDSSLPEAHNSLAGLYLFGDWNLRRADEESLRAIALNPNYAEARHLHCYVLTALNRLDEALEEQKRSTELDPFARPWALGLALIRARQFDAAVKDLRLRAEAQPQDAAIRFILSDVHWQMGTWKEYAQETERGFRAAGDETSAAAVRHAFDAGGGRAVAEWDLGRSKALALRTYVSPWRLAYLSARLGRKEETLRSLEDAYREHSPRIVFLQSEPIFDFLHSDGRYQSLVKATGFPAAYSGGL